MTPIIACLFNDQATYTAGSPGNLGVVNAGTITRTPVGARVSGNGFAGAFPLLAAAVAHLALSCGGATGFALWISFYMTDLNADGAGGTLGKTFINLGGSAYNTNCINDGGDPGISIGPTGLVKYNNTSNLFAIGTVRAKKEYKMLITGSPRDFQSFQTDIFFAADDGSAFGAAAFSSFTLFNTRANTVGWVGAFTQSTTAVISGYYLKTGSTAEIAAIAAAPNTLPVANLLGSPTIAQLPLYVRSDAAGGNDGSANDAAHALLPSELASLIVPLPDVPWVKADNTTWDLTANGLATYGQFRYGATADPLNNPAKLASPGLKWNGALVKVGTDIVMPGIINADVEFAPADSVAKEVSFEEPITPVFSQPDSVTYPNVHQFTDPLIVDGALLIDNKITRVVRPNGISLVVTNDGTSVDLTATTSAFTVGTTGLIGGVLGQAVAHGITFTIATRVSDTHVTIDRAVNGGMGPWTGTTVLFFPQDPTQACTESGNAHASILEALNTIPNAHCIIGDKCYLSTPDGAAPTAHTFQRVRSLGRSLNKGSQPSVSVCSIRLINLKGGINLPPASSSPAGSLLEFRETGTLCLADRVRVTHGGYYNAEWSPLSTKGRLILSNVSLNLQAPIDKGDGSPFYVTTSGTGAIFIARSAYSASNTAQDNQILIINDDPNYPGVTNKSDAMIGTANDGFNNGARQFIIRTTDDGTDRNFQFSNVWIYFSSFSSKFLDRAAVVTQSEYLIGQSGVARGGKAIGLGY